MENMIKKFGGRKMLLSLLIFIGSTLLLYFSKLDQNDYFDLVKYIVGLYVGGNVLQSALVKKPNAKLEFAEDIVETITEGQSLDQMGGRKFLFVIGVYLTSIVLLLLKVIDDSVYVDISTWMSMIYIGANVGGKAVENGVTIKLGNAQ